MDHFNNDTTQQVEVTVLFFAKSRELVEKRSAQISVGKQITGRDLIHYILHNFPSTCKNKTPSLHMADDTIVITPDLLHVDQVTDIVGAPSAGAISLFVGTTRDNFEGKTVVRLEYEAYIPMARSEMRKICKQVREKWEVIKIAIFHRIGVVPIGEASVIIAVSSAHRKNSLEAVQYCIDTLKATVPIWKKEVYEQGEPNWKENSECFWTKKGGSSKQSTV